MYNGHADVVALVDSIGNVAKTYYYDAFGNIVEETGNVDNNITYAGYQYDKETGIYYLNARMYDPVTARFLQEDTYRGQIDDPLSLNLYTYCHNEPIMYVDPDGHMREAYTDKKGVYHADPDAEQFGKDSLVYKALQDLSANWEKADKNQKKDVEWIADNVRNIGSDCRYKARYYTYIGELNSKRLNNTEKVLAIGNPIGAFKVNGAQKDAWTKLEKYYGKYHNMQNNDLNTGDDGTNKNAFLHAYWNALASKRIGEEYAKLFTFAHEFGTRGTLDKGFRSFTKMDLFNNTAGLYIGSVSKSASDDEIAEFIVGRVDNGGLLRVKVNGKYLNKTVLTNTDKDIY